MTGSEGEHEQLGHPSPPPLGLMESMRYVVEGTKIFEFKGLTGKILKTKALTLTKTIFACKTPYSYSAVGGALSQRISGNFRRRVPKCKERCLIQASY